MSKGDRDGRGFRHHKKCPSLNCDNCVNGRAKKPARRRTRKEDARIERDELYEATFSHMIDTLYGNN